jgi:hypothetical protein
VLACREAIWMSAERLLAHGSARLFETPSDADAAEVIVVQGGWVRGAG